MTREIAETAAWLDALYGHCGSDDGQLVVVAASRNRVASVHRVDGGRSLVAAAHAMHREPGSYLKINLMDYAAMCQRAKETGKPVVGNQAEVKTVVALFADVDAGKGDKYAGRRAALWAMSQMPHRPTLIVNTNGNRGGFHCYFLLAKPHRIEGSDDRVRLAGIAKSWQGKLKRLIGEKMNAGSVDSTANLDRVLRCVGVPRLDGGRVCVESCEWSRRYRVRDFE
jgi:hypothetical protein